MLTKHHAKCIREDIILTIFNSLHGSFTKLLVELKNRKVSFLKFLNFGIFTYVHIKN